jgi:peroxiredoxin
MLLSSSLLRKTQSLVSSSTTLSSFSLLVNNQANNTIRHNHVISSGASSFNFNNSISTKVLSFSKTTMTFPDKNIGYCHQRFLQQQQYRFISIGTDMRLASEVEVSLQKARPWYNNDTEGSNKAIDNIVYTKDIFPKNKTVVLFGVPAPFTGICTNAHYPPYKKLANEIKTQYNVHEIYCYSVSDPYSMYNWSKVLQNNNNDIAMICDDSELLFAKYYKLDTNYNGVSLGNRSIRFSMIVQNGIVVAFNKITDQPENDATTIIQQLQTL